MTMAMNTADVARGGHAPYARFMDSTQEETRVLEGIYDHWYTADGAGLDMAGVWSDFSEGRPTLDEFRNLVDPGFLSQVLFFEQVTGAWPGSPMVMAEAYLPFTCECHPFEQETKTIAYAHLLRMGQAVRCRLLEYVCAFATLEGSWPTYRQWAQLIAQLRPIAISNSAASTFQMHSLTILPFKAPTDPEGECPMCFDAFADGQSLVMLQTCLHRFHASGTDCLQGSTVLDWFSKESTCPVCRRSVRM